MKNKIMLLIVGVIIGIALNHVVSDVQARRGRGPGWHELQGRYDFREAVLYLVNERCTVAEGKVVCRAQNSGPR